MSREDFPATLRPCGARRDARQQTHARPGPIPRAALTFRWHTHTHAPERTGRRPNRRGSRQNRGDSRGAFASSLPVASLQPLLTRSYVLARSWLAHRAFAASSPQHVGRQVHGRRRGRGAGVGSSKQTASKKSACFTSLLPLSQRPCLPRIPFPQGLQQRMSTTSPGAAVGSAAGRNSRAARRGSAPSFSFSSCSLWQCSLAAPARQFRHGGPLPLPPRGGPREGRCGWRALQPPRARLLRRAGATDGSLCAPQQLPPSRAAAAGLWCVRRARAAYCVAGPYGVWLRQMECGCAAWHPQTRSTAAQTQLPAEHFWRERAFPGSLRAPRPRRERPRAHSVRPRCVVTGGSTRSGSRVAELYPSQARPRGAKAPGWRAGPRWRVPSAFFSVGWVRVQECFLRVEDPTRAQGSEFWPQGTAAWARDAGPQCKSSTRCTFLLALPLLRREAAHALHEAD